MKITKRFLWKTRRLFAVVFALIMVLGIVPVSALPTQAATDGVDNVYTVQWPVGAPVGSVRIHYVDENGEPIDVGTHRIGVGNDPANVKSIHGGGDEGAMEGSNQLGRTLWAFDLLKLVNTTDAESKYYNPAFTQLMFKEAYIIKDGEEFVINPMIFSLDTENHDDNVQMRYSETWSEVPYGKTVSEEELDRTSPVIENKGADNPGLDIFLKYKTKSGPTKVTTTVSNSDIGLVQIYMFDYPDEGSMWANGFHYWSQEAIQTGLYLDKLDSDGYPTYIGGEPDPAQDDPDRIHTVQNTSLAEYFTPGNDYYVGTADKLFQLDSSTGKYYYNSAWNSAYYDETKGEFTLYEERVAQYIPEEPGIFARTAWKKGNFYPYDMIDINKVAATNIDHDLKGTPVYGVENGKNVNCYFGMYMIGNIFQPENGQSIKNKIGEDGVITPILDDNGKPKTEDMTFTIRGDDDILVYIDDVLVLDLGGIHDPLEGTINFATGEVKLYDGNGEEVEAYSSTLKEKLLENEGSLNGHTLTDKDFKGNTFLDYSVHSMKIFYAERGGGASNLFVELNTPTKPSLPIKNSFWLDNKETPGKNYTKFNKKDDNIKNAQYILEELVNVDDYDPDPDSDPDHDPDPGYKVKLVVDEDDNDEDDNDEDDKTVLIKTNELAKGVSYPLTPDKKYHIEISGTKNGIPITIKSDEIVGSTTQDKIHLYTETIKDTDLNEKNYLVYNVQTVSYGDDAFNKDDDGYGGDYEFKDLDYTKQYRVVQQLYTLDNDGEMHPADGSSKDYPYEFTDLAINKNVTATNDKKSAQRVVTDIIGFLDDSNVLHYPEVEFKNVYTEVELTKQINENGTDVDHASVSDGGDVIYDIETNIPNYSNYPKDANIVYQIYDEPDDRLTYNLNANDFVTVKVGEKTLTSGTDYEVTEKTEEGKTYIVLTIKKPKDYPNKNINVTYKMQCHSDDNDNTPIKNIAFTKFTITPNAVAGDTSAIGNSNEDDASVDIVFGKIIVDNSFLLTKSDGVTEKLEKAPKPDDFANVTFRLVDGDGNKVEVPYSDFVNGRYTFEGLDPNKTYKLEVVSTEKNGGTDDNPYVDRTVNGTKGNEIGRLTATPDGTEVKVVNYYKEIDAGQQPPEDPTPEDPTPVETPKGKISVTDIFRIKDENGKVVDEQDNAPDADEYNETVKYVLYVKNKDGGYDWVATKSGECTFDNLDTDKVYQVRVEATSDSKHGANDDVKYSGTNQEVFLNVKATPEGTKLEVVNNYMVEPTPTPADPENQEEEGKIIVTDIFMITDKDGKVTQQEDAPDDKKYRETVKYVLYEKDGDTYKEVEGDLGVSTYDAEKGTYTFEGLDTSKNYRINVEPTDNSNWGETDKAKYTGTDQKIFYVTATKEGRTVQVVNNYQEPVVEPEKGSIVVEDIFKIKDKDGNVTETKDDAPNDEEYRETVKYVLYVKDGDIYKKLDVIPDYDSDKGTYTFKDLETDKDYQIRVEAEKGSKWGGKDGTKYTDTDELSINVKATKDGAKVTVVNNYVKEEAPATTETPTTEAPTTEAPTTEAPTTETPTTEYDEDEDDEDEDEDEDEDDKSTEESKKTGRNARTGDDSPIVPMTLLLLVALCGSVITIKIKKGNE